MAATTISDLPQDALVLIFRAVLDAAGPDAPFARCPSTIHEKLRCVSREWRDAADIAYIEFKGNEADLMLGYVLNPTTVRARFPSLIHKLSVYCDPDTPAGEDCSAPTTARALFSLCASSDLRRVLTDVELEGLCCADAAAAAVSAIAACPRLTSLEVSWTNDDHNVVIPPDMLAPLTALTVLEKLATGSTVLDSPATTAAQPHGALPLLPDIPSLSSLTLTGSNLTFALAGSAASLGRLRRLSLKNFIEWREIERWASNDPLRLRAATDDGTWRPHLLTGLQQMKVQMLVLLPSDESDDEEVWRAVYHGPTPAAAVWAPLAPTVTKLELDCDASIYDGFDLETGMYAGLGVLTGLRNLIVQGSGVRHPVDFGRVHLPHLTLLCSRYYRGPPIDLTRFPRLVHVEVGSPEREPMELSSVSALGRLASLRVAGWNVNQTQLNLAQLFAGGRPLAALTGLSFERVTLAWDAAAAPGAPAAADFAAQAPALLPSLRSVEFKEGVEVEEEVDEFVVPALRALGDE